METLAHCPLCFSAYNLEDKQPKVLFPCGHQVCLGCLEQMKSPQDQGSWLCRVDHDEPVKVEHAITNAQIVKELKRNFGIVIFCNKHNNKPAEFLNRADNILICSTCAIEIQDKASLSDYGVSKMLCEGKNLLEYSDKQEMNLEKLRKELAKHRAFGQAILSQKESYDGSEFLNRVKEAKDYFKTSGIEMKDDKLVSLPESEQRLLSLSASKILRSNNVHLKLLTQWIEPKYNKCELIYRGSEHGFAALDFHSKCDNKGQTLSLFLSDESYIFGGFTTQKWLSTSGQHETDDKAFIFSLTHQTKHPIIPEERGKAIFNYSSYLQVFGSGNEIWIKNKCNESLCSSNIGKTYQSPDGVYHNGGQAKTYLAGKYEFKLKEIEVYQLLEN